MEEVSEKENIKLDGTYRKLIDASLATKYGWKPKNNLDHGFDQTLRDFLKNR